MYFLEKCFVSKMIARYMAINETDKQLMVMRPYQVYAVEALVNQAKETSNNGYIWHTTGSGKTLTSFKASQILANEPDIKQVFFLVDRKENEKSIHRKIIEIYPKSTIRMQKEVISYLLTIAPEAELQYDNFINFKNGLFDLRTNQIIQHSPQYFTVNQININLNIDPIKISAVDNFLDRITCGNNERKNAILEMIGYSMTSSVKMQKAFVLYGKTAGNGKSTLLEIIEKLIGRENISHVTLQDFVSNRFSVSEIKGKLVNIVSEMTKEFLKDSSVFKQIVTGDIITVEEKFKDIYTIKPYAKHIFTANELPKVADTSNGYFRRLFIIPFEAIFTETEKSNFNFNELVTQQALEYLATISLKEYIKAIRKK